MTKHQHKLVAFIQAIIFGVFLSFSLRAQTIVVKGSSLFYVSQGQILDAPDGFTLQDTAVLSMHQSQVLSAGDVLMEDSTAEYRIYGVAATTTATFYSAVTAGNAGLAVVNGSTGVSAFALKTNGNASLGSGALPVIWEVSQTSGTGFGNLVFTWDASVEPSLLTDKRLYVYSSGQWTALAAANTTVGSYSLTYSGFSGPLSATRFAIASGLSVTLTSTNPSCFGGTGSISGSATGGIGTKTWKLDSGSYQAGSTFSSLAPGTYTVTVKDQSGNEQSAMATLTQPTQISASGNISESSGTSNDGTICAGATATISVSTSGGTGSPNYSWNNSVGTGAGPHSVTPTTSTTYTVTVTDANSCTSTASVTVTVASPTAVISGVTTICPAGSTTLTASGGGTYLWSNSLGSNTAVSISPASTTTYTVTVTAANGCTDSETATVTVSVATASISGTQTICSGGSTTLTASGAGSGTYAWSNSLGSNAAITVSPNSNTTYTVTVTNADGCTDTETSMVTVNSLPSASISGTQTICSGGSTTLTASGAGSGTYAWSSSLGSTAAITVTPGSSTTYTVTVTDGNGCTDTETSTVTVNSLPSASISGTLTICSGGSTTLTASGAGSGTYAWSNSLGSNAAITVTPGSSTTYTITVTDGNGCTDTETSTVTVNSLPSASISGTQTICSGGSTTLTASGAGSGTYAWSSSLGSTATITVTPGSGTTYTVTVTDGNGCTDTETSTVTVNSLPSASISGTQTICSGGSTTLTASGAGSGTYAWSSSLGSTAAITVTPGSSTTYTVTVTDGNGCTDTETSTVTVNSLPSASISGTLTICSGGSTTLTASGAGSGTYAWSNSLGSNAAITVTPGSSTTYTITVTDGNGCTDTETSTVTVNSLPSAYISGVNQICSGGSTTLTASGGTTYNWSNSLGTNAAVSVSPTSSTSYAVTVTDSNGCTDTETISLTVDLPAAAISGNSMTCVGGNAVLTATGGVSYLWSSSLGTNATVTVTPVMNTTYTVTVTNASSCTASATITVTVGAAPTPVLSTTETSGSMSNDGIICAGAGAVIQAGGGSAYLWSDGSTSSTIEVTPACTATYEVTLTDMNNCTATAGSTIIVNYPPVITGMNPLSGSTGTQVTITGSGLADVTEVRFDNVPGTGLSIINSGEIRVQLPASGVVQIININSPCGNVTLPVVQPSITAINPTSGAVGTIMTISGSQLDNLSSVSIGGSSAAILSKNATTATVVVMPGSTTGQVVVSTGAGSAVYSGNFTITSTVHPYIQQGNRLSSTTANGLQGTSVAMSADGSTAVVGGPADNSNSGAAWVYYRTGSTWSTQGIKLTGTGAIGVAKQGTSVAISHDGKTIILGGPADDSNKGAAWLFVRSGNSWSQLGSKLVGVGAAGPAQQGTMVAISGDGNTVAVGGVADDQYAGATWLFSRYGNQFLQIGDKLVAPGAIGKARQGAALSLDARGSTLAIGAYQDNNRQGAVWIFTRNECEWNNQGGKLVGSGGLSQAWQGYAVSVSSDGNTVIFGGPSDNSLAGSAWIFTRSGSMWNQQERLLGAVTVGSARFGSAVTLSADGTTAISGGFGDNSNRGAMWVYKRNINSWDLQGAKLTGSGANGAAKQGTSVSLSANGTTAILGGPGDAVNKGACWVYVPSALQTFRLDGVDDRSKQSATGDYSFRLDQNSPNPFSDHTVVTFSLPETCVANWEISDANGRKILSYTRQYTAGEQQENFSLNEQSGVYFCRLITPNGSLTRKFIIQQ